MVEKQPSVQGLAPGCSLWFAWIMTNSLGTAFGWYLGWRLSFLLPGSLVTLVIGITTGLILGFFQWFVLRNQLYRPSRWLAATLVGWAIGFVSGVTLAQAYGLAGASFGLVTGLTIGGVLAIFQWSVLHTQVSAAGWWLPANLFGWSSGMLYYQPGPTWLGLLFGLLAGMVTGIVLVWLLYRPVDDGD